MPWLQNSLNSKLLIYTARLVAGRTAPTHPEPLLQKSLSNSSTVKWHCQPKTTNSGGSGWGRHHQLHYRVGKCSSKPLIHFPTRREGMFIQYLLARDLRLLMLKCHIPGPGGSLLCIVQVLPGPPRSDPKASVWDRLVTLLMPPTS